MSMNKLNAELYKHHVAQLTQSKGYFSSRFYNTILEPDKYYTLSHVKRIIKIAVYDNVCVSVHLDKNNQQVVTFKKFDHQAGEWIWFDLLTAY